MVWPLAIGARRRTSGLRPTRLWRDLDQIADLLDLAFREERQRDGGLGPGGFSSLKGMGWWLWLLSPLVPPLGGIFDGFVWEERGRIVGTITVAPLKGVPKVWHISNVAVHPAYRRRGIARQITQAALRYAEDRRGELAVLEVRPDNPGAYQLYTDLGFVFVDGTTELRLRQLGAIPQPAASLPLRALTWKEWPKVYTLAQMTRSKASQRLSPLRPRDFGPTLIARAAAALAPPFWRPLDLLWGAEEDGLLVGWVGLRPLQQGWGQELRLLVHPADEGSLEEALVAQALAALPHRPNCPIVARVDSTKTATLQALQKVGFVEVETLHRLVLSLRDPLPA